LTVLLVNIVEVETSCVFFSVCVLKLHNFRAAVVERLCCAGQR